MPAYRWGYQRGASRLTVGGANEETKKTPDSRGYCRGFWWQVVSWEYRWVIYGFTPAGLQSHCTVQIRIRQEFGEIFFFLDKTFT